MGANAGTAVPVYASGEVLTAARLNLTNCGVPVFSGTATRDAAFGGSGEKVLAEGQLAYLEDANVVQYYDGAAWATVGPTTPGGLVRISGETAFSAVSSVTLDNVFTSTYRNYKIVINFVTSTSAGPRFRLRVGGASTATNTYNEQEITGISTTAAASRSASATSILLNGSANGTFNSSMEVTVFNPQIATPTTLTSVGIANNGAYTTPEAYYRVGNQTGSTAFDGFEIFVSSGNTTGNYTVYGLAIA